MTTLADAIEAIDRGDLVVFPTDTVYGLAGDACDATAVDRVFAVKGRDHSQPMALAVGDIEASLPYIDPTPLSISFMEAFLPGPVTVVCAKTDRVPDVLVGGRDRVGVRIPDHDRGRQFLHKAGPVTATSANPSGAPSVQSVDALDPTILDAVSTVIDGGHTAGGVSTVVDIEQGDIHRAGRNADAVRTWMREQGLHP